MMMHMDCGACHGPSRRQILQGGVAAAAVVGAAGGVPGSARAQMASATAAAGVPAIDIHAHYYPQGYFDVVKAEGARFNAEFQTDGQTFSFKTPAGSNGGLPNKFIDVKQRLAEMDGQGVAVQALSLTTPMVYWADGETSHKLAAAWNDGAIASHKAHPDRFVVLATLPMLDRDRAIDELNRVSGQPGVRGVYMGTNISGNDLDDPMFAPILARIEALDLPIFLHPLQTIGGKRVAGYHLANLLGNPIDTAIAASRLIFSGVLDRHPKLQVNLPHAGGVLPILMGRIDHGWKVRKENKHLAQAPSTYLRRFTYDTIAHSKPIMEFVISMVGADRIMIGSDYCFDMGYEQPIAFVDQLNLSPEQRKQILGGNAAKVLKLATT
jgi:aminocarboxymuconate-semialdehyde decarboxylase